MSEKLSAKDLIDKTWEDLLMLVEFRTVILEGLVGDGQWEHGPQNCGGCCARCGAKVTEDGKTFTFDWLRPCPVPPPITDPPEVVAERLRDEAVGEYPLPFKMTLEDFWKANGNSVGGPRFESYTWFAMFASPVQRIIVCLLALGLIGE